MLEIQVVLCARRILLTANWADKAIEVQRISDRIIFLKLIIGKAVSTFLLVYIPKVGHPKPEKEVFYDQLQYVFFKTQATEIFVPVVYLNGHVGNAHGGHGIKTRNTEFWKLP